MSIKLEFIDGSVVELPSLNTTVEVNIIEEPNTAVPLSKQFRVEAPFPGIVVWKTFGRNGGESNIEATPINVQAGSVEFYAHGLYIQGSTVIEVNYTNSEGVSRWSQTFIAEAGVVNARLSEIEFTASSFKDRSKINFSWASIEAEIFLG